tara:strand:+ start:332 stop:538 length:207 start_codon:yes stop_codon:yes gene_type:complete
MLSAECIICHDDFTIKRKKLGYNTCLKCGEKDANVEIQRRKKCVAPLFNKGSYQYVGSFNDARYAGKS